MVRVVAFVELCRGVEILSASECGLLSMSSCVVLTVLEKVRIIEFGKELRRAASRCEVLVCLSA